MNEEISNLERLIVAEERGKSNTHRLDEVEEEIREMKDHAGKLAKHDEDIRILKDQTATIHRMAINQEHSNSTLSELVNDNRVQMGKFTVTLEKVNESLTSINYTQREMSNEIKNLQKDVSSAKEHIEEVEVIANTNSNRGKLDLVTFFSDNVTKTVITGVIMIILGAWLTSLGIK